MGGGEDGVGDTTENNDIDNGAKGSRGHRSSRMNMGSASVTEELDDELMF